MPNTPINVQYFFSELLKKSVANEIVNEILKPDFDREAVNVDFHIKEGKMSCSKPWNTQIQFDADNSPYCQKVLKYLSEAEDPSKDDIAFFELWRISLNYSIENIITDKFKTQVMNLVFRENSEELDPISRFKVIDVDITNRPENDRVLVVKKEAPQGLQTSPITAELMLEVESTGRDINDIIAEKKKNGDSRYKWVTSATWRKHFYDITVSLMVDYLPQPMPSNSIK